MIEFNSVLHLLSQGYSYICCLTFCQGGVSSHHPVGGKNFRWRALFFGGGYIESENGFETLKGSTIE